MPGVIFYDHMGALRDIVQSHLMQVMALVMMEPPDRLDSDAIHIAKFALLQSVAVIKADHVDKVAARGQYYGYREEVGNASSNTETYAALSLVVHNTRWAGVPVLLRTGKSLSEHVTEINIVFKDRAHTHIAANCLTIRIQPDEGIGIKLVAKAPGFKDQFQDVLMNFSYKDSFKDDSPDAYGRMLVDCIAEIRAYLRRMKRLCDAGKSFSRLSNTGVGTVLHQSYMLAALQDLPARNN